MFCTNCGRELAPGDRFCTGCGMAVHSVHTPTPAAASHGAAKWENAAQWMKHHESSAARFVPKQLAVRFPHVSAYVFLGAYACIIVVVVIVCAAALGGGHDLSGTYCTDSFFPVSSITFRSDGTFTAYDSTGVLYGKYIKNGQEYSLRFTGGDAGGGNAVTEFLQENSDTLYELSAEKGESDKVLYVSVVPKVSYWAWYGKVVTFYKQ